MAAGEGSSAKASSSGCAHQLIELRPGDPLVGTSPESAARACGTRRRRSAGHRRRWHSPASRRLPANSRSARAVSTAAAADWLRRRGDEDSSIGVGHARRQIVVDHQPIGRRHLVADARGGDIRPGGAVEQRLLDRHRRAEVVERVGMIERAEREVGGRELALGQQGAEDEDRLIAALPRLGEVHLGQEAGARLPDALRRLALRSRELPASGFCARARAMASVSVSGVWAAAGAVSQTAATRR